VRQAVVEVGADKEAKKIDGFTALMVASQKGHDKCVEMLLNAGCNINTLNNDGVSALAIAVQNEHIDCVRTLVRCGADVNVQYQGVSLDYFADRTTTADALKEWRSGDAATTATRRHQERCLNAVCARRCITAISSVKRQIGSVTSLFAKQCVNIATDDDSKKKRLLSRATADQSIDRWQSRINYDGGEYERFDVTNINDSVTVYIVTKMFNIKLGGFNITNNIAPKTTISIPLHTLTLRIGLHHYNIYSSN
jgi:hypothetical protein